MGAGAREPGAAGDDSRARVPHPPALGSRRDGALPARRPRADRARRDRAARRRGDRGARRLPGARRAGTGERARLPDVALARSRSSSCHERARRSRCARRRCCGRLPARSPACERADERARRRRWRADCPPLARPAPLSLEAAREAHRAGRAPPRAAPARGRGAGLLPARDARRARSGRASPPGEVCLGGARRPRAAALRARVRLRRRARRRRGGDGADAARFAACTAALFGGPETISCPSCHWIGGPNGAGAETDNAFLARRRRAHGERRRAQPAGAGRARRRPGAGARDEPRSAAAARRPRARRRARRRRARSAADRQGRRLRRPARDARRARSTRPASAASTPIWS